MGPPKGHPIHLPRGVVGAEREDSDIAAAGKIGKRVPHGRFTNLA